MRPAHALFSMALAVGLGLGAPGPGRADPRSGTPPVAGPSNATALASLSEVSVRGLVRRGYASALTLAESLPSSCYEGLAPGSAYVMAYESDHLREYVRVDVPAGPAPPQGFPAVIFAHGWVGLKGAPGYRFNCASPTGYKAYSDLISYFVRAGFIVLTPGYRGHGTIEGRPADGIAFVRDWDNGSYVAPQLYAIDVLNLMSGLGTLSTVALPDRSTVHVDPNRVFIKAHSQGGDVALTVAAVASQKTDLQTHLAGVSIWAGTFPPPLTQVLVYGPMQTTGAAFLSGDGDWTGTARGSSGRVNPNFVFGYPSPSIVDPNPRGWTWQKAAWSAPTYKAALTIKLDEMYGALRRQVSDMGTVRYGLTDTKAGGIKVKHDPSVVAAYGRIGGANHPEVIRTPILLHHSDHDFYSIPSWNSALCDAVLQAGTPCQDDVYPGNTHELGVSSLAWFSPAGSLAGFASMLERDVAFFRTGSLPPKGR